MDTVLLSKCTQSVLVDGTITEPAPVLSSIPQGTVLGPLLFLAYINDINGHLSPGTKIRLFVEDSLLYRNILTLKESILLQGDLNVLQAW